jgi:hypothetical protein
MTGNTSQNDPDLPELLDTVLRGLAQENAELVFENLNAISERLMDYVEGGPSWIKVFDFTTNLLNDIRIQNHEGFLLRLGILIKAELGPEFPETERIRLAKVIETNLPLMSESAPRQFFAELLAEQTPFDCALDALRRLSSNEDKATRCVVAHALNRLAKRPEAKGKSRDLCGILVELTHDPDKDVVLAANYSFAKTVMYLER